VTQVRSQAQSEIRVRVKTRVRRSGKTRRARERDFFASGSIRVEGGDLKSLSQGVQAKKRIKEFGLNLKTELREKLGQDRVQD
jgi:hypothetical protein